MDLKTLFDNYGCDKGRKKHHYYLEYEKYFESVKDEPINLLEVGTYLGASTQAFHDYFTKANIYTIDVFQRTKPAHLPILKESRVRWLKANSMDASLGTKIRNEWDDIKFDFIIDDGAHWPEANLKTFKNLMPFLKDDGTYFIEDVWPMDRMTQSELEHKWLLKNPEKFNMLQYNMFITQLDRYKTKHHDRRKETHCGDTYIIAIKK